MRINRMIDIRARWFTLPSCEHGFDEVLAMAHALENGGRDMDAGEDQDRHRESLVQFLEGFVAERAVESQHPSGNAHGDQCAQKQENHDRARWIVPDEAGLVPGSELT